MIICLVFDIKRDGCVQVAKQHSENLGVNVRDEYLTILSKYSLTNTLTYLLGTLVINDDKNYNDYVDIRWLT